jgi:hypothetical protein
LVAYMETHTVWYDILLPDRRSRQVTKISTMLINHLISRVFSSGSSIKNHIKTASSANIKQWKMDVTRMRDFLGTTGYMNLAVKLNGGIVVTLEGRAFADVLGSVAGGKIEWFEEDADHPTSIAGSMCTEFTFAFTPRSFLVSGPNGSEPSGLLAKKRMTSRSNKLSFVTRNSEAAQISRAATIRKDAIASRVAANRRAALDLAL